MHKRCPMCGGDGEIPVKQSREATEKDLTAESIYDRDDAICDLLSLDDPASIPAIEVAIAVEKSPDMKIDMQQLLDQLKDTADADTCAE